MHLGARSKVDLGGIGGKIRRQSKGAGHNGEIMDELRALFRNDASRSRFSKSLWFDGLWIARQMGQGGRADVVFRSLPYLKMCSGV